MRDIRVMLDGLGIQSAQFCADYKDARGRKQPCFNLPKRETLILVSGYNVQMRAKIIDRWQELESRHAPDPLRAQSDPAIDARAAAGVLREGVGWL